METSIQINANDALVCYCGTETYYSHASGQVYTDGVRALARKYQAYWLIDQILQTSRLSRYHQEEFQVWILERMMSEGNRTDRFLLRMEDGNENLIAAAGIPYSDFAADLATLYVENNVLYLPSER